MPLITLNHLVIWENNSPFTYLETEAQSGLRECSSSTALSADGREHDLFVPTQWPPVMQRLNQQDRIPVHFTKSKEQINMFLKPIQIKRLNYKYFDVL